MKLLLLLFSSCLLLLAGCRKDERISSDPLFKLSFSGDSLFFDTVFTAVESASRRIVISNPHDRALLITSIQLAGGASSPFKMVVDGKNADSLANLTVRGKDSLIIFVRALVPATQHEAAFRVSDSITCLTNGNRQAIPLAAYGQNVQLLDNYVINQDATWNNQLPYLVYRTVHIMAGHTLTIQKGCRIYFHKDSRLLISGSLRVEGTFSEPVIFAADRLEPAYANRPGQWTGLHFSGASRNNVINHAIIKNAVTGIRSDSVQGTDQKLILANSILKNMQAAGFSGYKTSLTAFNNLFYSCGQYLVYGVSGGTYNLKQNTFANYNFLFPRQTPSLYFSDFEPGKPPIKPADLTISLVNNLVWGTWTGELVIERKGGQLVQSILSNLLKTTNNNFLSQGNNFNADPLFISPSGEIYRLGNSSPALNKGIDLTTDPDFATYLSTDLTNRKRSFPSELGCYEQ